MNIKLDLPYKPGKSYYFIYRRSVVDHKEILFIRKIHGFEEFREFYIYKEEWTAQELLLESIEINQHEILFNTILDDEFSPTYSSEENIYIAETKEEAEKILNELRNE